VKISRHDRWSRGRDGWPGYQRQAWQWQTLLAQDPTEPPFEIEDAVVGGGITADLSQTLGDVTLSATASNAIAANSAQTLGAVTLSSGATHPITADSSVSLDALGLSSAAAVAIKGDLAATLGDLTVASASSSAIAASLAQELGAVTLASEASSGQGITADLQQTLGDIALASAGTVAIEASYNSTLDAITLSADATVSQPAEAPTVQAGRARGQIVKRRRKPRFTVFEPERQRDRTPAPISAGLSMTLGDVGLLAEATIGASLAARARRRAAVALLLH
jgi:hypothetical protein